jgi:hypothetical protein
VRNEELHTADALRNSFTIFVHQYSDLWHRASAGFDLFIDSQQFLVRVKRFNSNQQTVGEIYPAWQCQAGFDLLTTKRS